MKISWHQLAIDPAGADTTKLLKNWRWIIDGAIQPMIITAMGDMFLTDMNGNVYWLNTIDGKLGQVASSHPEFHELRQQPEYTDEWFMPGLVGELVAAGKTLGLGEVYSFVQPPVLGGSFEVDNIAPCDIHVHFMMAGQLHEKMKDIPDGTSSGGVEPAEADDNNGN